MSKKKKGSKNRKKIGEKLAKLHRKIANIRKDYTHKMTTEISKNHAKIYVEKLNVIKMSRSARGTIEEPGEGVRAKSRLNSAILDQGWGEIKRQLKYKAMYGGGQVVEVSAIHTSQTCNVCKHIAKENRKRAVFICISCGHKDNADINAAKNIMAVGQTVTVCGNNISRDTNMLLKQKPESKAI